MLNKNNSSKVISVEISFFTPATVVTIVHSPINRVSNNMRLLVAVGTVQLTGGSLQLAADGIKIEYYTNDDAAVKTAGATITSVLASGGIFNFYTDNVNIPTSSSQVSYRISAKAADGTIGYYPADGSFTVAGLDQTRGNNVSAATGGTLTLQSGHQLRGDTTLSFLGGALPVNSYFTITEMYVGEAAIPPSSPDSPIITYKFDPDITISNSALYPTIALYYGDMPADITKIEVRWWNPLTNKWQKVNSTNNTQMHTATVTLSLTGTKLGYYAIFNLSNLTDNDYRPVITAFSYPNLLQFNNLNVGDSVTIYNLNGKQVRKLTAPPFAWDGRSDDGTYVESGTYIYQISVNGKIISGQIAFVR